MFVYDNQGLLKISAGGAAPVNATYLTENDETTSLPNSRQLLAGTNITFDDATPGERTINASGGGAASIAPLRATFAGGDGAIATPVADVAFYIPADATITRVVILTAGGTGSCVVDLRKVAFASYPPDSGDSICGASKPTITSDITFLDATLTGWDTALAAGDTLAFALESSSTFTRIFIQLELEPA